MGGRFLHGLGDIIAKGVTTAVGAYLRPVAEAVKKGNVWAPPRRCLERAKAELKAESLLA